MKYLFVSDDRVRLQDYRHAKVFRLAGAIVLFTALLQMPVVILSGIVWKRHHDELSVQSELRAEAADLQAANGPLNDVRRKLAQIRQWEPMLRNRMPISALLSVIENSIPPSAALDSISIESEQFEKLPVPGGVFRVPESYRLVLQGLERSNSGGSIQVLGETLLKRFPAGSEIVRADRSGKRADGFVPFTLQFSIKPTGNYFGLGVKRISEPDTL